MRSATEPIANNHVKCRGVDRRIDTAAKLVVVVHIHLSEHALNVRRREGYTVASDASLWFGVSNRGRGPDIAVTLPMWSASHANASEQTAFSDRTLKPAFAMVR